MSLDKQKILNELGSVVNQLQSAECGCMNNLFENQNVNPNMGKNVTARPPSAGCRRNYYQNNNCYHQRQGNNLSNHCNSNYSNCCSGYNNNNTIHHSCAGDNGPIPNNTNLSVPCNNYNPVKLYTDTYNYLNKNLVQPTIEEVYNDLKTITPENTVMNNPLAQQMGIPFQNQQQIPNNMSSDANNTHLANMNNTSFNNSNGQMGMGPNIVNMMTTEKTNINKNSSPVGQQLPEPLTPDTTNNFNVNLQPLTNPISPMMQTSTVQQVSANTNCSNTTNNRQTAGHNYYSPGNPVAKFNQMFPDIKNKFGDLGYDPMAIAIQMKAESAKQGATENMQKIAQNQNLSETRNNAQLIKNNQNTNQQQSHNTNSNLITQSYEQKNEDGASERINNDLNNTNYSKIEQLQPVGTYKNTPPNTNKFYNTLGQPVEILPADIYRLPRDTLPQTLSPLPVPMGEIIKRNQMNSSNFNNVKSAVSKTSLTGQNLSKNSQLQHLYNQYLGSQSFTHQNIMPSIQKNTISEGEIYNNKHIEVSPNINVPPMEKAAGDTLMNNTNAMETNNIATEKPITTFPDKNITSMKGRNGLQDVSFTSYPTTTSWSFHGGYNRPLSPKYYGSRF